MQELDLSKKRLKWQCRRGMLELDVLLGRYLDECFDGLNADEKLQFQALLTVEDPELYAYLMQGAQVPAIHQDMVYAIKQWSK